ncbi:acylamino-acid-releasing enzyme [alpha proteobacterium U9-1i]|nr:acylamino-acid-releasing enzyme [alpha proteobacterium U9-1i]
MKIRLAAAFAVFALASTVAVAQPARGPANILTSADVFNLEHAANPRISPDGRLVAYERVSGDIMADRFRRAIWLVDADGRTHRPLAQSSTGNFTQPVWSPNGRAIAYAANENNRNELRVFYLDTQRSATIARLAGGPANLTWSPDGSSLAFQMFTEADDSRGPRMPDRPDGAEWAPPARVLERTQIRADGQGFLPNGSIQIYVVPADGGAPRQLTYGEANQNGRMSWTSDGRRLIFAANAEEGFERQPNESDVYSLDIGSGAIRRLTTRDGEEGSPILSPDGRRMAYVGFDDRRQGYQVTELYVANADGSNPRSLTASLDRDVQAPQWAGNGTLYFLFVDQGITKLGRISANGGRVETVLTGIGGVTFGRPGTNGAFSVNNSGRYAVTTANSTRPSDISVGSGGSARRLTYLNEDVLANKRIPEATHITTPSSADGRPVHGWIVRPPNFDPSRRYPLILEIHGGPFSAYGPVFSPEVQLYAAAGYVVVFSNPRGSTSYGGEFGNLIHHAYPSQDYDDLMSIVDATIAQEPIDTERLYVTGGSGGGVLTAWIVGHTNRFRAALSEKPVINWLSFNNYSDLQFLTNDYWFGEHVWEEGAAARYWARSPLAYVGNVTTPTALMVGDADARTPMSESEQFYQALRARNVPTRLTIIPGAPHNIAHRPSNIAMKVGVTLGWFAEYGGPQVPDPNTGEQN